MTITEIYNQHNIRISVDEEIPCIVFTAGRLPHTDDRMKEAYRKLVQVAGEFSVRHDGLGLLADATGVTEIMYEDIEWSALHIMPRLVKAGIKKVAFVYGHNSVAYSRAIEYMNLADATSSPLERNLFDNFKDARMWLKERI